MPSHDFSEEDFQDEVGSSAGSATATIKPPEGSFSSPESEYGGQWIPKDFVPPIEPPPEVGGPRNARMLWEGAKRPVAEFAKYLSTTPQQVQDAFDVFTAYSPDNPPEIAQAVMEGKSSPPGLAAKMISGGLEAINRTTESMTSPLMLATMGAGALPKVAQRVVSGAFAADMLRSVPGLAEEAGKAVANGDARDITEAVSNLLMAGTFATGAARHAFGPNVITPPAEFADQTVAREATQPQEQNAIQNQAAGEVLRDVQEQSRESQGRVPAEESAGRLPQPPGDTGGLPPAEEAGRRALSLEAAKPEVAKQASSKFNNPLGDPLGTTYHATPEDWADWQKTKSGIKEALKSQDMDSPVIQDLFKENERIKNLYGGMPPEAPKAADPWSADQNPPPLPEEFKGKSMADMVALTEKMDVGKMKQYEGKNGSGQTGLMFDLGSMARTPEDVAALRKMAVDHSLKAAELKKSGTFDERIAHAFRQAAEAYEYATGVTIDGQPKWETFEKSAKIRGKEPYVPAVPDKSYLIAKKIGATPLSPVDVGKPDPEAIRMAQERARTAAATSLPVSQQNPATGQPMPPQAPGIAGSVREGGKWTGATSGGEAGAINIAPLKTLVSKAAPAVGRAVDFVREAAKEAATAPKVNDYRRGVLNWSSKLQRSFAEAAAAQKEILSKVPDAVRRDGITNWIQADGDALVLRQRAAASSDPKLRAGYEAALKLTPEELQVARDVKATFDALGRRGQRNDVLANFKDNYVTQIWDIASKLFGSGSSARRLKDKFKYSKASTFATFFDGEQAGYTPKTKDISKILPIYIHEMNSVIAARELAQELSTGKASDGEPLVAMRGIGIPIEGDSGKATLVMPDVPKGDTGQYKVIANQPALTDWRWVTKDSDGKPVFLKADMALHPEAYNRLKNVLGKSAIREWYNTPTTALAEIPKLLVKGLDDFNSGTKRTMLGLFAVFHQAQEGTHGVGHRVSPFGGIPKIDLEHDPLQIDATRHGLMLAPDRVSADQFMEGFKTSGLVSKIPGIGPLSDFYSNYLFHEYIPGLKFKTYSAILERNMGVYAKELASGKVAPEDVKVLSAEQANAAYGHLNYADMARNPTMQHIMQLGLLAPDFLEARTRFAGQAIKGLTGVKAGREQMLALATLALGQATAAYVSAKLSGGEWDKEHPFEFHVGSRKFTIRSVPEDLSNLFRNTRTFIHSRISPVLGKGVVQYLSGVDYAGRKVSGLETTKELATQWIPITARSLPGVRGVTGADRPGAIEAWQQLAGAIGFKISRYNTQQKINDLHADWMKNNPDPKIKADYEEAQASTYPVSKYKTLDSALADKNEAGVLKAIEGLRKTGQKDSDIVKRMRPFAGEGLNSHVKPLYHESRKIEQQFINDLQPEEKAQYDKAIKARMERWHLFLKVWTDRQPRTSSPSPLPARPPIEFQESDFQ